MTGSDKRLSEQDYRRQWENPPADTKLYDAERFSDAYATAEDTKRLCPGIQEDEMGPKSRTVRAVLTSCCAGWVEQPTSRELFDALRTEAPNRRQRSLIDTWGSEATIRDIILAWAERAYTMRQLVAALQRAEFAWPRRIHTINQWIER